MLGALAFSPAANGQAGYTPTAQLAAFQVAREQALSDPYRPAYHFFPPGGTMNDPNGATFWKGKYHLFYQFVPGKSEKVPWVRSMHWGHTVSDDLVHWEDLPIALAPEKEKGDGVAVYSGQTMVDGDRVIAMYHGKESGNCIATSSDPMLLNWEKNPSNPVIPKVPGTPYNVFDPCIWKVGDTFYSLSAGTRSLPQQKGLVCDANYLFKSKDLTHWEYIDYFYEGGIFTDEGEDGAVPNFFPLGDKWMLIFSAIPAGRNTM